MISRAGGKSMVRELLAEQPTSSANSAMINRRIGMTAAWIEVKEEERSIRIKRRS